MSDVSIRSLILLDDREKSMLVEQKDRRGNRTKAWLPKSQLSYTRKSKPAFAGDVTTVDIKLPEWLAEEKLLNYD